MYRNLRNYSGITVGCIATAVALDMFLIPCNIAAGGVSGMAIILHHLFGWQVGVTMLALNVPLFLISLKVLGARFGINTLFGAAILSIATDFLAPFTPALTQDILLNSLYGGVLSGVGMGIVFRYRGTTAGTDLLAAILNKLFNIRVGQALLATDFFVISAAGIAFHSAEAALYALISLFVTTQIIDLVQEGRSEAKAFFIISEVPELVSAKIMSSLERGVTLFNSRGGFSGKERDLILCVVNTSEVSQLKDLVYEIDQAAFVIVADAHEVLGKGFSKIKL